LRAGAVSAVPAPAAAGTVLRTSPAVGVPVPPGTVVGLEAASGTTIVPRVVGLGPDAAEAAVRAAGLVPERSGGGSAAVLATSPPADVELAVGSAVALDLGTPPPSPTPSPTPTPSPSPTASPSP
ncbi:PASTA domain-containing protein, partial [Cellulomonas sp. P5_C6]